MSRFSFARSGGIALLVLLSFVAAGWGVGSAAASHWAHHDSNHGSDSGYECEETGPPTSTRQCMGYDDVREPVSQPEPPSVEPYDADDYEDCEITDSDIRHIEKAEMFQGSRLPGTSVYAMYHTQQATDC